MNCGVCGDEVESLKELYKHLYLRHYPVAVAFALEHTRGVRKTPKSEPVHQERLILA